MSTTPPAAHTPTVVRDAWVPLALTGVLTLVLGILVLLWPGPSILVAAVIFGIYLVVSGVTAIVLGLSLHVSTAHRVLLFISGALSLVLGLLAFRHFGQGYAALLLALWIGIGFIFHGVATTLTAISHPDLPGRAWNIIFGSISVIAGVVVMAWPFSSLVTLAFVSGIWLIIIGGAQIVTAVVMHRDLKRRGPTAPAAASTAS
jgi:uncharacterized membrane protein HdeD (DUF308 family)